MGEHPGEKQLTFRISELEGMTGHLTGTQQGIRNTRAGVEGSQSKRRKLVS